MQKYLLTTLVFSTCALQAMTQQEKQALNSLAPKCISFCEQTLQNYKKNMLRASQEHKNIASFFENQEKIYKKIIDSLTQAISKNSHTDIYNAVQQFTNLVYGNAALLPHMWPVRLSYRDICFLKKIKAARSNELAK